MITPIIDKFPCLKSYLSNYKMEQIKLVFDEPNKSKQYHELIMRRFCHVILDNNIDKQDRDTAHIELDLLLKQSGIFPNIQDWESKWNKLIIPQRYKK